MKGYFRVLGKNTAWLHLTKIIVKFQARYCEGNFAQAALFTGSYKFRFVIGIRQDLCPVLVVLPNAQFYFVS